MEHISNENVCVNYAFYNTMSVYDYYSLDFDEVVNLYQVSLDFTAYLNTSVKKRKNYFFYFGCLLVKNYLNGHQSLDVVVQEFVSDHRYVDCPTGDLLKLCCNHQKIMDMGDFCLGLQQYFSRKKKLSRDDIKVTQWILDNFYDKAKEITKFHGENQSILELRARYGRKNDDNDGFLESLLLLVKESKFPLKVLHALDADILCWAEETKQPVIKEIIAEIAFESVSKVFYRFPETLMFYQERDLSSAFILLLSALRFFHSDQMKDILISVIESGRFLLYLRAECALLLLDFFKIKHELLHFLIDRVFYSNHSDVDIYFPSTRIGCIEFFKDDRFFSIGDLVCLYKKREWSYQALEVLTYKMSIDQRQAEIAEKLLLLIDQELERMKGLAAGGQDIKTIVSFEKIIELLLLDKAIDRSAVCQRIVNIIDFFHRSGFGDISSMACFAHKNKFSLPELYRGYLGWWDRYALCLADQKISGHDMYQRFAQCGVIRSPFEFSDICDFFSDLDWRVRFDRNRIEIEKRNFNMHDIFNDFCRDFLGTESAFFRYDDALNVSDGVVVLNSQKVVASWSEFVKYYTMGVNDQQYSCFMYNSASEYYESLASVLLMLLKVYKPNLSLYYFADEYGYYDDYEFFGADELLFDQLIKDIDYPCRKVKFFEPLQPTTEFLQIESELNKIISDQGFYSIIQPDDFIDLSKKKRGISRDEADWLVSMIPEMQARASLPNADTFAQALQVRNLFVALAREMIYDKGFANQLNRLKPLWTREQACIALGHSGALPPDWSVARIVEVLFEPQALQYALNCVIDNQWRGWSELSGNTH